MSEEQAQPRIKADPKVGLTKEQVQRQIELDLVNHNADVPTKSIKRIIIDNTLTLFNVINIILGIAVFLVGSYKNLLFLGVMFCNIAIGIFQEIRAKRTIDKLSIISSVKVKVIRNGKIQEIGVNDIVLDDILELSNGNQIPSDCILISGNCDVNESLLTGESDSIHKQKGDKLLSGSFIVSGSCRARVECVGKDNYASSISAQTKYIKKINSEIMDTLNKIIKIVTFFIVPIGVGLAIHQYNIHGDIKETVLSTVTQLIGMIPEGLILLTSTVLAVSVIRLSKHKVLVQELYCIETLARVDVLCLDKTGTITEGCMELVDVIPYGDNKSEQLEKALTALTSALDDNNATFVAIREKFHNDTDWVGNNIMPFSSEKKWSGANFEKEGTYVIGAAEFILKDKIPQELSELLQKYSKGYRSLIIVHSKNDFNERDLPDDLEICGLLLLVDKIRAEAPQTLQYFDEQGVEIKVISGDNVLTVSDVARRAGVKNYDKYIDATTLKTDEDIEKAILENTVFGRVTPAQKKKFVQALQANGHTVAMTGDGVNDAPSLKAADIGIAMGITGTDVAKGAADMVLTDDNFASIEKAVEEGRGIFANIKKTIIFLISSNIAEVLAMFFIICLGLPAPLIAIHLLWVNLITDSLPAIALGMDPKAPDVLDEKPRDPKKGIFADGGVKLTAGFGVVITVAVLISYFAAGWLNGVFSLGDIKALYENNASILHQAQTMAFTTLAFCELFHMIGMSNVKKSFIHIFSNKNWMMALAFVVGIGLQFLVIEVPAVRAVFSTANLTGNEWIITAICSVLPLIIHEIVAIGYSICSKKSK